MKLSSYIIPVLSLLLFASPVLAVGRPTGVPNSTRSGMVRSCQAREAAVKTRIDQLVKMATNMETVFTSIEERVQKFYTDKVLAQGLSVANYDALLSDIQAKKAIVDDKLTKAKDEVSKFDCDTGDPRAVLNQFRIDMQAVKVALKNYRTSVKNLIVAVHGVIPEAEVTPTPTPTLTPTPTI